MVMYSPLEDSDNYVVRQMKAYINMVEMSLTIYQIYIYLYIHITIHTYIHIYMYAYNI